MKTTIAFFLGLAILASCGSNTTKTEFGDLVVSESLKKEVTNAIKSAEEKLAILKAYAAKPNAFPVDTLFKKNEFIFHEDEYHITNMLVVSSDNPTDIYGKENKLTDYMNVLRHAKEELRKSNNKKNMEDALTGLKDLKYVMVYHLIMSKKPKMAVGGFDSGIIMAQVDIIDLDAKKIILSDNIACENSDNVEYRSNEFPFRALNDDLAAQFNKLLKESLRRKGYVDGILPVLNISEFSDSLSMNL